MIQLSYIGLKVFGLRKTRSSATAEIARDADDVDYCVDDMHSGSSVVVLIEAAYMTFYLHSKVT